MNKFLLLNSGAWGENQSMKKAKMYKIFTTTTYQKKYSFKLKLCGKLYLVFNKMFFIVVLIFSNWLMNINT